MKKTLLPSLRFPDFRDAPQWQKNELNQFLTESRVLGAKGNTAKKITVKLWGKGVFEKNDEIQGSINTQYYSRAAGQFIYSKLDFLNQAFGIIPKHLGSYQSTVDLPCFDIRGGINPTFLLEYVKRKDFYERLGEAADGSRKARRIHADTFLSFPIFMPPIEEQQKIADCLSSIDALISAQSQKVEALKTHKKGLMQQLFPKDGETLPRLRFPEFRDVREWHGTTFGAAATFINGKAYKQEELLDQGKYRVLRVGNFFTNKEWYFSDLELEEDKYCDRGDLLYAWSASFGPRIWSGEKVIYHYHIWKVVEAKGIDKKFLFVLLDYETDRMKATSANGLGLLHITKGAIESWKCCIPNIKEQQKIANFLESLDTFISAQSQKLDSLKNHKKGLMQALFPAVDEVKA